MTGRLICINCKADFNVAVMSYVVAIYDYHTHTSTRQHLCGSSGSSRHVKTLGEARAPPGIRGTCSKPESIVDLYLYEVKFRSSQWKVLVSYFLCHLYTMREDEFIGEKRRENRFEFPQECRVHRFILHLFYDVLSAPKGF